MTPGLEDYAIIGDCETAALVARDGSIDWLCWPRFDSGACFAALVGTAENGRWRLAAADPAARVRRRYRAHTLILETAIETASGAVTVIDFMPVGEDAPSLIRLVRGDRGEVAMRSTFAVRFDYGSLVPWVTGLEGGALRAVEGPDMVVLYTAVPLHGDHRESTAEFTVAAGQTMSFVLRYGPAHRAPPGPIDAAAALAATASYWDAWAARARRADRWSDAVSRSLITLKALTHGPTGAVMAAPTTSLPERPGGARNWDYRFCWLRDATFTLITLMNAGYYEDARAWRRWLLRAVAGDPARVQIMYGVMGEHRLPEWQAPWLAGYQGAKPVRIGNAAATQTQIDVYGEVTDALHHGRQGKLGPSAEGWDLQRGLLEHLETIWQEPDHGLWEVRGGPQHFTHSKVMTWVAFDRAVKAIEHFGLDGPVDRWRGAARRGP